uniref:Reverse transcriptase domain-containing protein n=1 Tax=Rhabditophanes sp. KR3021 TaxID=114890 RepID=A0AC35U334_9BILA
MRIYLDKEKVRKKSISTAPTTPSFPILYKAFIAKSNEIHKNANSAFDQSTTNQEAMGRRIYEAFIHISDEDFFNMSNEEEDDAPFAQNTHEDYDDVEEDTFHFEY